ncbi:MAG: hypothetical protein WDN31_09560 [Hyphomicrobium sp.]
MRVATRRVKLSLPGREGTAFWNASGGSRRNQSGSSSARATALRGAPSSISVSASVRVSGVPRRLASAYMAPGNTTARSARREDERIRRRTSRRAG